MILVEGINNKHKDISMELPFVGDAVNSFVTVFLSIIATLFVFALCFGLIAIVIIYIVDVTRTRQAIRRNYPVVGHFRYFFEHLGEFFRQYFFSMDREELPFNRAERVASFQDRIVYEVGIIAHSCGVHEPRQLRRFHCRVVEDSGRSIPLDELYPDQTPATPVSD